MPLHPFQDTLIAQVGETYRRVRAVVMHLSTGGGKTHVAASLIKRSVAKGRRVIFAAHLDALIDDTSERLSAAGVEHGIVQADRPTNPTAPVQVCSLATLHRRGERPPADFLVLDECHRAGADSVRAIQEAYPKAKLLGLTATPERGDGQPLDMYERMVSGPSMRWLTANGYLVPAHVIAPGDVTAPGALAMDPVESYMTHARGLPAMVFARDAVHAADVWVRLGQQYVQCALILGDTTREERREVRARLQAGEPLVLVGCGVFVEGWNSPEVRAIILARAFGFVGSYLQACGRGLRTARDKTDCLIVDLTGTALLHGLPQDDRIWSLTDGVRRTGDGLTALVRCGKCLAVFHVGPRQCPRCGAPARAMQRQKRRATRIERQELSRLDTRPQYVRDAIALRGIEKRLEFSGKFAAAQIPAIARSIFQKTKRRAPSAAQ
jgi:DNA repair protein RadD